MTHDPIIAARGLTRRYGRRIGVDDIDLDVSAGALFGFLGPNGAGKTTFIRLVLGFLRPSEGSVRVLGHDAWGGGARVKRDVGYLPGDLRLYPWMTAAGALAIAGGVRGLDLREAGRELAERFELETTVRVRAMSRGMRQKVGLILALAHRPRLLILDEPTSGLDPIMQDRLAQVLRERAAEGATVFFSSHTLSEVEQLCDSVAIVRRGRIVASESLRDLRRRARRSVTIDFKDAATAAAATPPAFLSVERRHAATWRASLIGETAQLVQWVATQPVVDLILSPPDLESLFRAYYGSGEGVDA
ncbi:MAG: ATP-binding cassette domain-containing protein [Phycisphaerales bacterium]|nr:ATP-binding cassette domain-containing protein [Phycisphaerales bacterium]